MAHSVRRHLASQLLALLLAGSAAGAQSCVQDHYRWPQKTTTSLVGTTAKPATISAMLNSWGIPAMYAGNDSECDQRQGRELNVYSVRGYVRRVLKGEADGDWHIEVTSTKTGTVRDKCLVVEIPSGAEGHQFDLARAQFNQLIADAGASIASNGDVSPAVRMRIVGPAFFDAEHRGARGTDNPPHQHGRCNSTSRALWEIHPVYAVYVP